MKEEQIKRMEDAISTDYNNMVGIVILKDGETIYENYYNGCSAKSRIHVFSVTKSIVSILIGIALDKGLIESIDDKGGVRTNIKMNQFDYNLVYETARIFAKRYSEEIVVQDKTQESVFANGIEPDCASVHQKDNLQ